MKDKDTINKKYIDAGRQFAATADTVNREFIGPYHDAAQSLYKQEFTFFAISGSRALPENSGPSDNLVNLDETDNRLVKRRNDTAEGKTENSLKNNRTNGGDISSPKGEIYPENRKSIREFFRETIISSEPDSLINRDGGIHSKMDQSERIWGPSFYKGKSILHNNLPAVSGDITLFRPKGSSSESTGSAGTVPIKSPAGGYTYNFISKSYFSPLNNTVGTAGEMNMFLSSTNRAVNNFSSPPGKGEGTAGSAASIPIAGFRASGGPVEAGKNYVVGEQGPEILRMGNSSGMVFPSSASGSSGSINVVLENVNITTSSGVTGQSIERQVREALDELAGTELSAVAGLL